MKRGQLDFPIITFLVVFITLLILAPIMLKVFNSVKSPVSAAFGNATGGTIAQQNFDKVMNVGINFWDKIIVFALFAAFIIMIISAFLIDTNPFWVILYIFIAFMLVLFAPSIVGSLDGIYNSANFATEVSQLTFIGTLRDHFGVFLLGIIMLTGIIIYGKIFLFSKGSGKA